MPKIDINEISIAQRVTGTFPNIDLFESQLQQLGDKSPEFNQQVQHLRP